MNRAAMNRDGSNTSDQPNNSLRISVIIPAFNEQLVIGRCLASLVESKLPKAAFEVILVDNGSIDRTLEVVRSFQSDLHLTILTQPGVHISALRNRGAAAARSDILAFLDADCIAPADWLSNATGVLSDADAGVVGAPYEIPHDASWVGRVWYQDRLAEKVGNVSYIPGGDLLIRREHFLRLGGFDESIQTNEDFEFCQRAIAAGLPIESYPQLRVVHLGTPRTVGHFYRKHRWHGTHAITVFFRDPEKKHNFRPVVFSFYTLACVVGMLLALIAVAAGAAWILVAVPVLALLLPLFAIAGLRSVKRKRIGHVLPLTFLYLTYGLARATCALNYKAWRKPRGSAASSNPALARGLAARPENDRKTNA